VSQDAVWRANAERWIKTMRTSPPESRAVTNAAILDAAAALKTARVLDLGCGEGLIARLLARRLPDCRITGVDGSESLIKAARRADPRGDYKWLSYEAIAADPARLNGPYDAAIANFALFEAEIGALLRAVRQSLNPDGRLLIQTLHPDALQLSQSQWLTEDFNAFDGDWTPMRYYARTIEDWRSQLAEAGFDAVDPSAVRDDAGAPVSLLITAMA